jgi:hypothetical protein
MVEDLVENGESTRTKKALEDVHFTQTGGWRETKDYYGL